MTRSVLWYSLARAHDAFARADSNTAPWVRFFHEADLDALSGVVNATLPPRTYTATTEHLYRAVEDRSPDMGRSQAVDLARRVRSVRVIDRLAPLQQAALDYRTRGETADLAADIATLRTS